MANNTLLISAYSGSGSDDITAVSFNGVSLTKLQSVQISTDNWTYLWGGIGIPDGTATPIFSGAFTALHYNIVSYINTFQSGFPDNSNQATTTTGTGNQAFSITTVADNCWVVGMWQGGSRGGSSITAGSNTVMRTDGSFTNIEVFDSNGLVHPAGSRTLNLDYEGTCSNAIFLCSLKPNGTIAFDKVAHWADGSTHAFTVGNITAGNFLTFF